MSAKRPLKRNGIDMGYERMLRAEQLAGDDRLSLGMRLKARFAAELMRDAIEKVPENE